MASRKSGKRSKSGRLSARGQFSTVEPSERVLERRAVFNFVQLPPDLRQDGRNGEIDSEVSDGIGQLCAVGLLDGHGHEARTLRDHGRMYGLLYWKRTPGPKPGSSQYERSSRSTGTSLAETPAESLFKKLDDSLGGWERAVVMSLVADKNWTDEIVPWANGLIAERLLEMGRIPPRWMEPIILPTVMDREYLNACIRGLCQLVDGALPSRWAA